jgi:hypothetical protein
MLLTDTILEYLMKKYHILLKIQKNKESLKNINVRIFDKKPAQSVLQAYCL